MKTRNLLPFVFLLIVGVVSWRLNRTSPTAAVPRNEEQARAVPPSSTEAAPSSAEYGTQPETREGKHRRLLVGNWQDEYKGKRTMTLSDDGTGTMIVELTGVQATLFASQLQSELQWSLDGTKIIKTTVGGEPAKKVHLILKMMGDTAEDTILEISDDRLLLRDKDGKTEYDWKRVSEEVSNRVPGME